MEALLMLFVGILIGGFTGFSMGKNWAYERSCETVDRMLNRLAGNLERGELYYLEVGRADDDGGDGREPPMPSGLVDQNWRCQ